MEEGEDDEIVDWAHHDAAGFGLRLALGIGIWTFVGICLQPILWLLFGAWGLLVIPALWVVAVVRAIKDAPNEDNYIEEARKEGEKEAEENTRRLLANRNEISSDGHKLS